MQPNQRMSDKERIRRLELMVLERARPKVNHLLHVLLVLFTGGLWLPVYAYQVWKAGK